jgi:hypothetical protein
MPSQDVMKMGFKPLEQEDTDDAPSTSSESPLISKGNKFDEENSIPARDEKFKNLNTGYTVDDFTFEVENLRRLTYRMGIGNGMLLVLWLILFLYTVWGVKPSGPALTSEKEVGGDFTGFGPSCM